MNRKERNELTSINGQQLKRALLAGIGMVLARQDYLNKINVFPVPDADTGTNMAMTLSSIADSIAHEDFDDVSTLFAVAADSALQGARGNSGAILAQLFQGMSDNCVRESKLSMQNFATVINGGAAAAQEALASPREGTILSVLREFAHSVHNKHDKHSSLWNLFLAALKDAEHALKNTTKQLEVLKKAGVVDAGAQGFIDFLHGIKDYVETGELPELHLKPSEKTHEEPKNIELNTQYRYCTECLIIGENINLAELRRSLTLVGDSLIVAGSTRKTKIHIHANEPDKVFEFCAKFGKLENQKADDMIHQQKIHNKHPRVAIMTDSGADIPADIIEALDIHMVPLSIQFGESSYIDKISLTSEQFYKKLKTTTEHPKTSQPSASEFNRVYHYLSSHYEGGILAIHMSSNISGTMNASELAAKQMPDHQIQIIDSLNACGAEGLLVTHAAKLAQEGLDIDEIKKRIKYLVPKTHLHAAFPSLEYGVRGGRVSKHKRWVADLLRLSPVLGLNAEGFIKPQGVLKGRKNLDRKLAEFIFERYSKHKRYSLCVVHADAPEAGQNLLSKLLDHYEHIEQSYMVSCGAVIGSHSGPGCIAVGIQVLD